MPQLMNRNALVTGGGTGIGFGCAERLRRAGANVVIAGRRQDVLEAAADRLRAIDAPGEVGAVGCDITDETQVARAVARAARGGNLDVLVANAGSGYPGAILQLDAAGWDFCLRLNVTGTALCIKHAGLVMREHGGGSIVAISSTSGVKTQPWLAAYATSKAGLDMLVRCAAMELSSYRIRVNSIQPGYVPTDTLSAVTSGALELRLRSATPLGRPGTPDDIGHAVVFLASDEAGWITGQAFGVDGGLNVAALPSMGSIAETVYGADVVRSYAVPDFGPGRDD